MTSPSRKDANLQMCVEVEKALIEKSMTYRPIVFIKDNVKEATKEKIKERILQRGGKITVDTEEATHIVHPKVDPNPDLYCRPVFRRGDKCLVHFMQVHDRR